jgi:hypothetical protein
MWLALQVDMKKRIRMYKAKGLDAKCWIPNGKDNMVRGCLAKMRFAERDDEMGVTLF